MHIKDSVILVVGGTGLLGSHIITELVQSGWTKVITIFKDCPYNRIKTPGVKYIQADICKVNTYEYIFEKYDIRTIVLSLKPPILGTTYEEFIKINYLAIIDLLTIAKKHNVNKVIYISSIACANHYKHNIDEDEHTPQPLMTEYIGAYDISKRLAEDYILSLNSSTFHTVSIRISGLIGKGDEFVDRRQKLQFITREAPVLDQNYVGNVALAIIQVIEKLNVKNSGMFYYYTGQHLNLETPNIILKQMNKIKLFKVPNKIFYMLVTMIDILARIFSTKIRNGAYSVIKAYNMRNFSQTFKCDKFHQTFGDLPEEKTTVDIKEWMKRAYLD